MPSALPPTRNRSENLASVRRRLRGAVVWGLLITFLLLVVCCDSAEARRRRRRSRGRSRAAAAAAAKRRKQQMIQTIQKQIQAAQRVLAAAQSKGAMSQQQVSQALAELSSLHSNIEAAREDVQAMRQTLRSIEEDILDEQEPDSEYGRAEAALEKAKKELHRVVHSYVHRPDDPDQSTDGALFSDLAQLSNAQRKTLEADRRYHEAKAAQQAAGRDLEHVKQALFEKDSYWVSARKDLTEAENRARDTSQQAAAAGVGSLGERQDLRDAQKVAAMARAVIQRGQARLRALGVKSTGGSRYSKSKR